MHDEASSLDIHHLAEELRVLEDGKINKVYEWEDQQAFIFDIYADNETHNLRLKLPGLLYVTERRFQAPKIPPGYARFLRNKLTASRITSVQQHSFDRLIEFNIHSHKHGDMTLIFEVFKPANIILIDDEDTIIHPYRQQTFKDRIIRSNESYEYPPARLDTPDSTTEELVDALTGEDNIEKTIAVTYGLGGTYASEVIERTGVDPSTPAGDVDQTDKEQIATATKTLFDESNPRIIGEEAYPIRMESLPEPDRTFDTFSDALDTLHDYDQVIKHGSSNTQEEKYKTIINAQQNQIDSLEDAIEENQRKATYLYENYNDFATLIYTLREKESTEAVKDALAEMDNVVSYDEETNEVTLRFDDDETTV